MRSPRLGRFERLIVAGLVDSFGLAIGWTAFSLRTVHEGGLEALGLYNAAMLVGVALSAPAAQWLCRRMSSRALLRSTATVEATLRVASFLLLLGGAPLALTAACVLATNVVAWTGFAGMRAEVAVLERGANAMTWYVAGIAAVEGLGTAAAALLPSDAGGALDGVLLGAVVAFYALSLTPTFLLANGARAPRSHRAPVQHLSKPARSARPLVGGAVVMALASWPTLLAVGLTASLHGVRWVAASAFAVTGGALLAPGTVAALERRQLPTAVSWSLLGAGMVVGWIAAPFHIAGLLVAQVLSGMCMSALEGDMDARVTSTGRGGATGGLAASAAVRALGSAAAVAVAPRLLAAVPLAALTGATALAMVVAAALWGVKAQGRGEPELSRASGRPIHSEHAATDGSRRSGMDPMFNVLARHQRTAWSAYLLALTVAGALYFALPHSALSNLVLYNGLGLSAVLAILIGVRRNRPAKPRPWYFFAAGQLSFLTANLCFYVYQDILSVESPFPSIADVFYLGMYPLVIVGLLLLMRDLIPGRDRASLLDASIISTGMFVLAWVFVMDSYIDDDTMTMLERVLSLAYPMMDVLLLAVAVRLAAGARLRAPALSLISGSIVALLVADTLYALAQLSGTFETGSPIAIGWMLFYVLFGAAALHPSMRSLSHPSADGGTRLTLRRLLLLSLATLAVPLVDLFFSQGSRIDEIVTSFGAMTLFVLVLARVVGLVRTVEESQERLRHGALHDSLTQLANRVLFADRIDHALARRTDAHDFVAVLFIDLDDFKTVNDSLGHHAGDELLVRVAERLSASLRGGDTPARLGGDEFAVLLDGTPSVTVATDVAERILEALRAPIIVHGRELLVAASVGIAIQPRTEGNAEVLLRGADVAMYLAKAKGKGRYEIFEQAMYDQVVERLELKADLQVAQELDQLELHYQPIVALDGAITGVEALLRWHHATRGIIPPIRFIPLAEETGLIVPIGRWVLRRACLQARQWQQEDPRRSALGISVNLSVRQLHDPRLVADVTEALHLSGLDPRCLTLEVTESVLMLDVELATSRLQLLKALGVRIAIDDFGTGYSSLSYLQRFPVDTIKIDRSFVRELGVGDTSSALVRSVVDLASALSMQTVAEGIEDSTQLAALSSLKCGLGQGFYFSKPLTAGSMGALLGEPGVLGPDVPPDTAAAPVASSVRVYRGPQMLEDLGPEFDDLHAALAVPIMARRPWLTAWVRMHPEHEPWAVVVRGAAGIDAAALLATRERDGVLEVVGLGHGRSGCIRLPARAGAEQLLATGVVEALKALGQPWQLHIEQLPEHDPVAASIVAGLEHGHMLPDLRVPRVSLAARGDVNDYFSRNTRKALRRAANHVSAEGLHMKIAFDSDPSLVTQLIDEVEQLQRQRDRDTRRQSDLDDPAGLLFWRESILAHAAWGQIEIATLRLDGELAAYVVAALDGSSYRVLGGRFETRFAHFSPGRLMEAAALQRALGDERFTELDWMNGVAAEKLLTENASQTRCRLVASSVATGAAKVSSAPECLDCAESADDAELVSVGS